MPFPFPVRRRAVALLLAAGALAAPAAGQPSDEERLLDLKAELMAADYRADLEELARGRAMLAPLAQHPTLGYLACYWAGFAAQRLAVNGTSRGMAAEEVERHLASALGDFDASLARREDFADAHVGVVSVTSWLLGIEFGRGGARASEWLERTRRHLARAYELEPDNPRLLWVHAGIRFNTPAEHGGSQAEGMELWRRAVEASRAERAGDPLLPDWGEPESLMSIAWARLHGERPDPAAAREPAEAALRLRPDWYYVRAILLPAIEEGAAAATAGSGCEDPPPAAPGAGAAGTP